MIHHMEKIKYKNDNFEVFGVSYLYFMKNTGNITSTQNIEFNVKS